MKIKTGIEIQWNECQIGDVFVAKNFFYRGFNKKDVVILLFQNYDKERKQYFRKFYDTNNEKMFTWWEEAWLETNIDDTDCHYPGFSHYFKKV